MIISSFGVLFNSCSSTQDINVGFASKENNACNTLRGKVVVYAIFVDSRYI